jgi:NADH-quinone oxidoreductase subunit L
VAGVILAVVIYSKLPQVVAKLSKASPTIYRLLSNKWWFDEIYAMVIVKPLSLISQFAFLVIDRSIIDNAVEMSGIGVKVAGEAVRRLHAGRIHIYALTMVSATVLFLVFWLLAH